MRIATLLTPLVAAMLLTAGCANRDIAHLPSGAAAYGIIPAEAPNQAIRDYVVGPADQLDITVYREPELSLKEASVDASGQILVPLIGTVQASGMTATALSREIARRLGDRFLVDPQVTVNVKLSSSQSVTVEGSVTKPGIYEIKGPVTLVGTIALAEGVTRVADSRRVVVFRYVDGVRNAAVFDLQAILDGRSADPAIRGKDTVVVGYSSTKAGWRDFLQTVPLLAIFRPF